MFVSSLSPEPYVETLNQVGGMALGAGPLGGN